MQSSLLSETTPLTGKENLTYHPSFSENPDYSIIGRSKKKKRQSVRKGNNINNSSTITTPKRKTLHDYNKVVHYTSLSTPRFLVQKYGSIWPFVLPWCAAVLLFTCAVVVLKDMFGMDLTIHNSTGHSFMSLLVSFLVVTRTTIIFNKVRSSRQFLKDLFVACQEIVQEACIWTYPSNTNPEIVIWRNQVAYMTLIALRSVIAAVEYKSSQVPSWEQLPECVPCAYTREEWNRIHSAWSSNATSSRENNSGFSMIERKEMPLQLLLNSTPPPNMTSHIPPRNNNNNNNNSDTSSPLSSSLPCTFASASALQNLAHGPRDASTENGRVPYLLAYHMRTLVLQVRNYPDLLLPETGPLQILELMSIMNAIDRYVQAWEEIHMLIASPFPFPLAQMTRVFLLFWVFSLPLVLIPQQDNSNTNSDNLHSLWATLLIVFGLTYGFSGLEYVNMQLSDPFGQDENDFPARDWSDVVSESIYVTMYKTDGYEAALALKNLMVALDETEDDDDDDDDNPDHDPGSIGAKVDGV